MTGHDRRGPPPRPPPATLLPTTQQAITGFWCSWRLSGDSCGLQRLHEAYQRYHPRV
jgi:hypothetical protein